MRLNFGVEKTAESDNSAVVVILFLFLTIEQTLPQFALLIVDKHNKDQPTG